MKTNKLSPTLPDLKSLARSAGSLLRKSFQKPFQIHYKGTIDLVTEADFATEAFLLEQIRARFPDDQIFTEESGAFTGNNDHIWYIDPIDGTVNFSHRLPQFCVSIGFASHGDLQLAAVYDPMRNEMFSAQRGKGAFLNGKRIHVSAVDNLSQSLLVTGFPYDVWKSRKNLDQFSRLIRSTQGVRCQGSAVLDGCYVAAGRLDGFWEFSLKPWDVAAVGLIAQEAGACVSKVDGDPDILFTPVSILIAAPAIYEPLLKALRAHKQKLKSSPKSRKKIV